MNLQDLPDMSDALKKVQQFDEKKKLDPVGKEDGDVDNDGDKDSSDEYLMKRRKAIGKAMKKEAYIVTNADKKGNTPAYQNYKKGMKGKDGKPLYKAADHMKESGMTEEEIENIERISQEFDAAMEEGSAYGITKGSGKAGGAMKDYLDKKAKKLEAEQKKQKPEYRNNPAFGDPSHHSNAKNK